MRPCDKCGMIHSGKCDALSVRQSSNNVEKLDTKSNECECCGQQLSITDDYNELFDRYVAIRDQPKSAFDKKAYQREYMRKRRAKG